MKTWRISLVAALAVALTGCSAADKTGGAGTTQPTPSEMTMANGMTMGPMGSGSPKDASPTMPAMTNAADPSSGVPGQGSAALPSDSARLVCGPEIGGDIGKLAGLSSAPKGTATWVDHLYTCTYQLPAGPLVLSVKDLTNQASGLAYFRSLRDTLDKTRMLGGLENLGLPAYESTDGHVVFLKDGKTLDIDASALTGGVGRHNATPSEVAYEVGTDVIGCWSE